MTVERASVASGWPWQFFELAGAILLALGRDGRVIYINQKGAETLGYPVGEILDEDWLERFVPARVRETVRRVFAQVSAGAANAPERFENPVLCRDGCERIIAWRNGAVRDPSGRTVVALSSGEDVTEQREAESALRESEIRFRATFEQAAVGMAHVGLDWRFLRLNEKLCEITGYTRTELEARTFGDITHPDDLEADLALAEALREGRIPHYTIEKRYIRKDGSTVWVKLTGSLVRNCQGRPDYFIAVVDDITLRKQAERLLADEELQRMALSCADAGAWEWNAAGSLSWMEKTYQVFGLDPAEGPPDFQTWLARCVHRDDRHFFEDALRRAADVGSSDFRIEFRCTHPELGLRWVTSVGRVICDERRRPERAYGIVLDITEKRRKEEQLHASEERLRMAMEAGDIAVWDWDVASGNINWSENFADLLCMEPEAFPTTVEGWRALVHPDDLPKVELALARALTEGEEYSPEYRMLCPDGQVRWTATRGMVIRDDAGLPLRVIGIDRDVTARRASDERQERLIGELDHRVRNLLTLAQSIACRSITPGPELDRFINRLVALGKAHELLSTGEGETADLMDLVALELAPYGADRISIRGTQLRISARSVQSLALALHELTTNAVKYGALSVAGGAVAVNWSVGEGMEPMLELSWIESGGPVVSRQKRTGFGSQLLRGCLRELGGRLELSFPPEGVRARLSMPLAEVAARVPELAANQSRKTHEPSPATLPDSSRDPSPGVAAHRANLGQWQEASAKSPASGPRSSRS